MECRWSHGDPGPATLWQGWLLCRQTEPGLEERFKSLLLMSRVTQPTKAPN